MYQWIYAIMTISRSRLILQFIPKFSSKLNLYSMSPLMSLSGIFKQVIFINWHYIDAKKRCEILCSYRQAFEWCILSDIWQFQWVFQKHKFLINLSKRFNFGQPYKTLMLSSLLSMPYLVWKKNFTLLAYLLVKKMQMKISIILTSELCENLVSLQHLPTVVRLRLCHCGKRVARYP